METPPDILICETADGSPSARLGSSLEAMHSEGGALAETLYVYRPAVRLVIQRGWRPRFLSVGLGLGYHELMLASEGGDEWSGDSYEAHPGLRAGFLAWVRGEAVTAKPSLPRAPLAATYQRIAQAFGGEPARLALARAAESGRWHCHGALGADTPLVPASSILFDAFSRASSPELWTEAFLVDFVARAADENCVFATYAATATLKRVLASAGFRLKARRGFGRKRECTFAVRSRIEESERDAFVR